MEEIELLFENDDYLIINNTYNSITIITRIIIHEYNVTFEGNAINVFMTMDIFGKDKNGLVVDSYIKLPIESKEDITHKTFIKIFNDNYRHKMRIEKNTRLARTLYL